MQIPYGKLPCPSILTPRASGNQLKDRSDSGGSWLRGWNVGCMARLKKVDGFLGTGDQMVNAVGETNEDRFCVQTSSIPWCLLLQKKIMDGTW